MQLTRDLVFLFVFVVGLAPALADEREDWSSALAEKVRLIDEDMPGNFGVYVRHLGDGQTVKHRADRDWYLASTIKIPLGVALMQRVEDGDMALDDELTLRASDYVDGGGELLWAEPGTRYSLSNLNRRSIIHSDSSATDMLIRHLGAESFNNQIRERMVSNGLGPITTILQVRHDAWSEVHEDASMLTNRDFIEINQIRSWPDRYQAVLDKMGIDKSEADAQSTRQAFDRYYQRGINSGSLEAFGVMLERLVKGELLNEDHTSRLLDDMEGITTGDRRIKAGLPSGATFAHKTGTQVARSCNIGVLNPREAEQAVIVAACAEDYDQIAQAERAYRRLGQALGEAGLVR
ncbi:MAG: serine hydrolase [Ectothiorhodospiraceae bacterium]|nr:serine hydrolase [Ectothiorhodospiraceae bacterium]MCH8503265.1 class A beta-lactamase-related serine hydrolase [Ectothiorhodospiraceae bacterium]